ncbi:methyl accepting chemotaxis protein II, aspartate sensor-receptor [Salmonella bongori]|nr:methyl accepting chemotaxis protein II, aspartate sensor-receptor [Salmonella bongori]
MLQTRINLSRSAARMMMDAANQQSSAKTDLLQNAKNNAHAGGGALYQFQKYGPIASDGGGQRKR